MESESAHERREAQCLAEARRWMRMALEARGLELDDFAAEVLKANSHLNNARKMLREEKTP